MCEPQALHKNMGCSHLLFLSALYGVLGKMCFLYQYVLTYFAKCLILQSDIQPFTEYAVAPCVGAWIETKILETFPFLTSVAPCVGAWIETIQGVANAGLTRRSHPCLLYTSPSPRD